MYLCRVSGSGLGVYNALCTLSLLQSAGTDSTTVDDQNPALP